ncbi:hypothetical protein GCM10025858_09700 [Alicyclobacillus sacchari]|nr:hypothetical protein GCM10025858_09700 [Alicyclobacillus sacchari]
MLVLLPFQILNAYVQVRFLSDVSTTDSTNWIVRLQSARTIGQMVHAIPAAYVTWIPLLTLVYVLLVFPLMLAMVSRVVVGMIARGMDVPTADAGNDAFRRLPLGVLTIVMTIVLYAVGSGVWTFGVSLLASVVASISQVLAYVLTVLGSLAYMVASLWFFLHVLFLPVVVAEEGVGFFRAIRRCFIIARGDLGRLVGFFVLLFVICSIAQGVLTLFGDLLFPTSGGSLLVSLLVSLLTTPFVYVAISVMYLDMRTRKHI